LTFYFQTEQSVPELDKEFPFFVVHP